MMFNLWWHLKQGKLIFNVNLQNAFENVGVSKMAVSKLCQMMACCLFIAHYRYQYRLILDLILESKFQWKWNQNTINILQEMEFANVVSASMC